MSDPKLTVPTESAESMATEMVRAAPRFITNLTGVRKAAVLCLALGDDVASQVFKFLEEDEVQQITREIAGLLHVPSEITSEVVEEFHQILLAHSYVSTGGVEYAKRLLYKAYGPEVARRLLDKITKSLEASAGFDALQKVDPQQLLKLFQSEHPQTIAMVLAHMNPSMAADTLNYMSESQRADVALRMANLQAISQDVIRRVSLVLDQKLRSVADLSQKPVGGVTAVAEMCNRLNRDVARTLLEGIESADPAVALEIRNLMVTFDDLLIVDDVGIREILRRIDKRVIALALKGTVLELQERFFSNMSKRAVEMLREEMDYMGQVRMKDVSNAQREVVDVLRALEDQGTISLNPGTTQEELYVN